MSLHKPPVLGTPSSRSPPGSARRAMEEGDSHSSDDEYKDMVDEIAISLGLEVPAGRVVTNRPAHH